MAAIINRIASLQTHDDHLKNVRELLETAEIHVKEADSDLRDYIDGFDLDPQRLQWLESRIDRAHALARKHNVGADMLPSLEHDFEGQIAALESRKRRTTSVRAELKKLEDSYLGLARTLHHGRSAAASRLASEITADIRRLGMPGSEFEILVEHQEATSPSRWGSDRVDFQVTTNPGQPLQPLANAASGGELSRLSLAIHVLCAGGSRVPTLIFDEVDSGIGGRVAELVGQKLRELGESRQVLCITHLPQVAAQGHNHYTVRKVTGTKQTSTRVDRLSGKPRIEEVARMLGGLDVTQRTIAHAKEMLNARGSRCEHARRDIASAELPTLLTPQGVERESSTSEPPMTKTLSISSLRPAETPHCQTQLAPL